MNSELSIKGHSPRLPIIQGGMAVGISLDGLSSAVANAGGVGVIATAGLGMITREKRVDFGRAYIEELIRIVRAARRKTDGIIGVNIMVALSNYRELVMSAIKEKVDVIFSGAGLPLNLPSYLTEGSRTALVPIVSSLRSASVVFRRWLGKWGYIPDAFVVEGPKAGGHLGYREEDLDSEEVALEKTLPAVRELTDEIEKKHGKRVPVIAAGGIVDSADVDRVMSLGASGVQVGTAFVATEECDADIGFKEAIISAAKEDVVIIRSPVGLPGRAVINDFLRDVGAGEKKPFNCPYHCIVTCDFREAPYCIARALINASKGNLKEGFAFAGSEAYRINKITTVSEVMKRLTG